MRVVGDIRLRRLGGHHVRVERFIQLEGGEHAAQRAVAPAVLGAEEAAQADRVRKAFFQPGGREDGIRKHARERGGKRGGDLRARGANLRGLCAASSAAKPPI